MIVTARTLWIAIPVAALALLLSGCAYDYLQHTDRVSYHAGDAEKANIEGETTNPGGTNAGNTGGLGADGPFFSAVASNDTGASN